MAKKKQKVLVTGSEGMLGHDVVKALEAKSDQYEAIPTEMPTLDVTDVEMVRDVLLSDRPDTVLHLAAYTDVDGAEKDRLTCWRVNAEGTKNIAFFCREIEARMIYISTDYVFDGNTQYPYLEQDDPQPINFYGESKLGGEIYTQALVENHKIIRTSWLCGPGGPGKNFVESILRLAKRDNVLSIVTDQVGKPTFTFDLARALVDLIDIDEYGIFHITNKGRCTWYDFAAEILEQAKIKDVKLKAILSDELHKRPARRPAFSALENKRYEKLDLKPMPSWQKSLEKYLKMRKN